jgi:hypothetical protein
MEAYGFVAQGLHLRIIRLRFVRHYLFRIERLYKEFTTDRIHWRSDSSSRYAKCYIIWFLLVTFYRFKPICKMSMDAPFVSFLQPSRITSLGVTYQLNKDYTRKDRQAEAIVEQQSFSCRAIIPVRINDALSKNIPDSILFNNYFLNKDD